MPAMWRWLVLLTLYAQGIKASVNCSSCQGTAGSDCDVNPWRIPHTVSCEHRCITWRSLYATGRGLRTIWRGCEGMLIPSTLPANNKDNCGYGNFFVECTRSCEGDMCNQNHTGIPHCWSCQGDYQPCHLEPPQQCGAPVTTTATPSIIQLECVACSGAQGEICDTRPYLSPDIIRCNSSCVTRRQLLMSDRSVVRVWRGCESTYFPGILPPEALNSCHSSDDQYLECTSTCTEPRCNKYQTGFTECWTDEGNLKPPCETEDEPSGFQPNLLDNLDSNAHLNTTTADDLPEGTVVNCTSCRGVAGGDCDVTPHDISLTVPCEGACVTRRTLYANGRRLRSIWRGCDRTLFPLILDERFRNRCQRGNFFVECTDTCRTGDKCNQNMTGIPQCWSCLGDPRSCDIEKEKVCPDPTPVRPTQPPRLIQCVSCTSGKGDNCDVAAYRITTLVPCNSSCYTRKSLFNESRQLDTVWRGCYDNSGLKVEELDKCSQADNSEYVNCVTTCNDPRCNKYSTGFPECWTEEGKLMEQCWAMSSTTEALANPSRISTTKKYSIQDASGGDNYRGEWRPPGESEDESNDTDITPTRRRLRPIWGLSGGERPVALQLLLVVCSLALTLLR